MSDLARSRRGAWLDELSILTSDTSGIMMSREMRTTLTLDDDVAAQLRERSRATGSTFKEVVNEAIRAGLQAGSRPMTTLPAFRISPRDGAFRIGVDMLHLNRLSDELETEAFEGRLRGRVER
jgi:hypothetical protein